MPTVQSAGQPNAVSEIQTQQPGALGSVGNLRFKGVAGATPRAGSPNIFQQSKAFLSKLVFYCTAGPQARGQQFARDQAEAKQRALGDLLGRITAPAGDKGAMRSLASELARVADMVGGDLSRMPGGKAGLRTQLQGLSTLDMNAVAAGVLSQPGAHDALISMISPGLRDAATVVLAQLTQSLDSCKAALALEQPLAALVETLGELPLQGDNVGLALDKVAYGLYVAGGTSQAAIGNYVCDLPDADLRALVQGLKLDDPAVMMSLSESQSKALSLVSQAVKREGQLRLDQFSAALGQQLSSGTLPDSNMLLKECQEKVESLGMGSRDAVLRNALSLPGAITGLSDQRAGQVIDRLSGPDFAAVNRSFDAGSEPVQGRFSRLLEVRLGRIEAAEANETSAFKNLEEAMSSGDSDKVALSANNYKHAVRELGEAGSDRLVDLPADVRGRLIDTFGVSIDSRASDVVTTLQTDVRAPLTQELERPVPGLALGSKSPAMSEAVLPVNGQARTFLVGESFHKDAVERPSVSLSVSGKDPEGRPISTPWQGGESLDDRSERLGQALDSLERVAGPMFGPLTHLMQQQFCAGLLSGLNGMGNHSPFKLPDGSVALPVGSLSMHFDLNQQPDGDFKINMTMRGPLSFVVKMTADETTPVSLDPTTSWVEMNVAIIVAADGNTIREAEAPRTRHNFMMLSEQ